MKFKILIHLASIFVLGLSLMGTTAMGQDVLSLEISGLKNDRGQVMVLVQSAAGDTVLLHVEDAGQNNVTIQLELTYGDYAISTYHDENGNQILDKSFWGYPTERYGFSNNAREMFGPPPLKNRIFRFDENSKVHRIKIE